MSNSTETQPVGREMSWPQTWKSDLRCWLVRLRRRLPYLVWYDDELDITVMFSQDKLNPNADIGQLWRGAFSDAERIFNEMGITFDKGMGCEGRDWEWDWSLKGPISIRFRARASKPELRMERLKPKLVVSNKP